MKRTLPAVVVLLTFSIGVASNSLWNLFQHWDTRRPPTGMVQKVGPYWIYVNQQIPAEAPADGSDYPTKVREDSVFIVFSPTGEFASLGCALATGDRVEKTWIIAEDDFIVHRGTWKRNNDGTVTTTWRLSDSSTAERIVIFKTIGNVVSERGLLDGGGSSYVQLIGSDIGNPDVLQRMITADNL